MMKNGIYLLIAVLFWACSPEAIEDCFSGRGSKEIRLFEVEAFDRITIRRNIELHITHAENQSLKIEAGENIINGIDVYFNDGHLEIEAQELCASGSKNPPYIVHLETPNLKEIRNSSQFKVISTNTLVFDELRIDSENYNDETALASGDFELDLELNLLYIVHAGLSDFHLKGTTNRLDIGFYSGTGRIFAKELIADKINIYHRGFANVHVFPIEEIKGTLASTGDLIVYNQPDEVNIESFFEGQLIFNIE